MAELKTNRNKGDVEAFLKSVPDEQKRRDSFTILELMKQVTGKEPEMWGESIIGFGSYHYKYESGREGDWFVTGFSPRKQNLTLYIMSGSASSLYQGLPASFAPWLRPRTEAYTGSGYLPRKSTKNPFLADFSLQFRVLLSKFNSLHEEEKYEPR